MKLIVGLGNPGDQYIGSRHNLGFEAIEAFAKECSSNKWSYPDKFKSELIKLEDKILLKPHTYMNNSGQAVSKVAKFYKIKVENIIIIHDELDLLLGKMKIRQAGGAGGHHGVESIIEALNNPNFIRIRLGIGTTEGFLGEHKRISFNADKFVMQPFLPNEYSKVKAILKRSTQALEVLLNHGLEKAQNQFH